MARGDVTCNCYTGAAAEAGSVGGMETVNGPSDASLPGRYHLLGS